MATRRLLWAYKPLAALGNRLGLVDVTAAVGDPLIAAGDAQDWFKTDGRKIKKIEPPIVAPPAAPARRATKQAAAE